jgi:hypothetical protein
MMAEPYSFKSGRISEGAKGKGKIGTFKITINLSKNFESYQRFFSSGYKPFVRAMVNSIASDVANKTLATMRKELQMHRYTGNLDQSLGIIGLGITPYRIGPKAYVSSAENSWVTIGVIRNIIYMDKGTFEYAPYLEFGTKPGVMRLGKKARARIRDWAERKGIVSGRTEVQKARTALAKQPRKNLMVGEWGVDESLNAKLRAGERATTRLGQHKGQPGDWRINSGRWLE